MTDDEKKADVRDYLSGVNETIRRSKELIEEGNKRIAETKAKCEELGITPEELEKFDFHQLNLPDELMQQLQEDEDRWQDEYQELLQTVNKQRPDEIRQERLNKLGAMLHPYRL